MVNKILKFSGSLLIKFPSLNKLLLNYKKESLRIVYYHMVSETKNQTFYFKNKSISPKEFRTHIRFLKKHYEIISLEEAIDHIISGKSLERKLAITFDDGFKENYTIIAPILKEENVSATFFVISDCIDNKSLMWRNIILAALDRTSKNQEDITNNLIEEFNLPSVRRNENFIDWSYRTWSMKQKETIAKSMWQMAEIGSLDSFLKEETPYLTKNQIKVLLSEGFSIGSHSKSHPDFSKLSYEEFHQEISHSVKYLNDNFGLDVNSFSYPFGERASLDYEKRFRNEFKKDFVFLGISNKLENHSLINLERDNLEFDRGLMMFRFTLLPMLRRFMNI